MVAGRELGISVLVKRGRRKESLENGGEFVLLQRWREGRKRKRKSLTEDL